MARDDARMPRGRDPGDGWADGALGRFWGRYGAAGLLAYGPGKGVLLQYRAPWSDHGDTWGLPGGALHVGESPLAGALREAREEAGVPPKSLTIIDTDVLDLGYWSYTTVVARVVVPFEAVIGDAESIDVRWVTVGDVAALALHPGFKRAWPRLRPLLGA